MRVVIVGTAAEREALRKRLAGVPGGPRSRMNGSAAGAPPDLPPIDVVAEFATEALARAAGVEADAILTPYRRIDPPAIVEEPLTPREIEVLELLAQGLPNKAIAARLRISDQTVKFHVSSICGKLPAANRTEAVRRAIRRGLVTI